MSKLIQSNEDLLRYIPNSIREVKGEVPLFDKMGYFLDEAEMWLSMHIVPEELFPLVEAQAATIVVLDAYRHAIPHLDLVLTANGFATVGSQNLTPASKMRADRLVEGLLVQRDLAIDALLAQLPKIEPWLGTQQARWFSATIFPFLNVVSQVGQSEQSMWAQYVKLRSRIIDIETMLANEFFSPELLASLRPRIQSGQNVNDNQLHLIETLRAHIIQMLNGAPMDRLLMVDLVNFIRQHPADFPEWQSSATAELFAPPVFKNNKYSSGYFF